MTVRILYVLEDGKGKKADIEEVGLTVLAEDHHIYMWHCVHAEDLAEIAEYFEVPGFQVYVPATRGGELLLPPEGENVRIVEGTRICLN